MSGDEIKKEYAKILRLIIDEKDEVKKESLKKEAKVLRDKLYDARLNEAYEKMKERIDENEKHNRR